MRIPKFSDYAAWSALREVSQEFLQPWEPSWPQNELSKRSFKYRIKRYHRDLRMDASYAFFIFDILSDQLLGGLTITNVRRGVAQTASLGYWTGQPFANRGVMGDAVTTIIPFAFADLGLNRLEAACLPANVPSQQLLRRAGFTEEGMARSFLKINGSWRDHIQFALLKNDLKSCA